MLEKEKKKRLLLDKGEITQLMIIIAGLAVAAVVVIGATAGVLLNKGEAATSCIAEFSTFESSDDSKRECENIEEEQVIASNEVIVSHYGTSSDADDVVAHGKKLTIQKEDLTEISKSIEDFYKEHGRYPKTKAETVGLEFTAQEEAYSDYDFNLHYCPSVDGQSYLVLGYVKALDGKGQTITYTSNKNSVPRSYYTDASEMRRVNADNVDIGGASYCYSGVDGSAADRAGLDKIGGDMVDMGNNRFQVPMPGWSGITPGKTGFAHATRK